MVFDANPNHNAFPAPSPKLKWAKKISKEDIAAAKKYLRLVFEPKDVDEAVQQFEKQGNNVKTFKARDILRASQNELKPETNEDVREQFVKIFNGEPLAPILLVRKDQKLFIADGYHRMCAAYYLDKESKVHCVAVGIE